MILCLLSQIQEDLKPDRWSMLLVDNILKDLRGSKIFKSVYLIFGQLADRLRIDLVRDEIFPLPIQDIIVRSNAIRAHE